MSAIAEVPSTASSIAWMSDRPAADSSRAAIRNLVSAAKKGDTAAFGSLVDLYQERVFRTANSLLGSESDARDAVQEVFLKAYCYSSKFDDSGELAPWLYKVTTNVCRDMAMAKRHHQGAPIEVQGLVSTSPGPFECVARREQRHLTRLALARLPYKQRETWLEYWGRPRQPYAPRLVPDEQSSGSASWGTTGGSRDLPQGSRTCSVRGQGSARLAHREGRASRQEMSTLRAKGHGILIDPVCCGI